MKSLVNVNRSGRFSGGDDLPAAVTSVEIAKDSSAVLIDFDVYLMTSTAGGWRLLTFAEYLEGQIGSRVLAMMCTRDGSGSPFIESVKFVADVLGLSKPFLSSPDSGVSVNTICMVPYLRPGQFGEYRSIRGTNGKWNVRSAQSIDSKAGILFRPSFDVCQLALHEAKSIYMSIDTMEATLVRTCRESPSSAPTRRSEIIPSTSEGGVVNMDGVMIQDDGSSLSPFAYSAPGINILIYSQMWSVVGMLEKSAQPLVLEPLWAGLRSYEGSADLSTVLIPQSDFPAAAPTFPNATIAAVYYAEYDVPLE